ncbi:hypothetical protein IW137_004281 [Coemansia sp. RSA 1287]|nr:hypothetical protein IW137_004281 [Coemansia sp. RSA 1287]
MDALLALTVVAMVFGHCLICCWNVYAACKEQKRSFWATLPQLAQYFAFAVSCYVWLRNSTTILADNHLVLFLITAGTAFGRIVVSIKTHMHFTVSCLFGANLTKWLTLLMAFHFTL